jgi:hypothetical protein
LSRAFYLRLRLYQFGGRLLLHRLLDEVFLVGSVLWPYIIIIVKNDVVMFLLIDCWFLLVEVGLMVIIFPEDTKIGIWGGGITLGSSAPTTPGVALASSLTLERECSPI